MTLPGLRGTDGEEAAVAQVGEQDPDDPQRQVQLGGQVSDGCRLPGQVQRPHLLRAQGGRVRQTIIEMESAFLFVSAAGHGTCLAVLSTGDADIGLVAYEMAVLVRRSNEHLGVAARPPGTQGHPQGQQAQPGHPQGTYQQGYPGPGPAASYQASQPRVAPAPNSVYAPYPTPAGPSGPAPYPE